MAGNAEKSIAVFQRTLDLQPRHDKAAFQLADVYHSLGKVELTTLQANYLRLLRPNIATTHCHYLHQAAVSNMVTATDMDLEFRLWGERFIPKNKNYTSSDIADPDKLRIGFIVGEIPSAWWTLMVVPVINRLSAQDSVVVFWQDPANRADNLNSDVMVEEINSMSDAKFARLVREHEIDILIDVCGMRSGCRQRALGLQLASRQLGWLAHEGQYATASVTPMEDRLGEKRFCFGVKEDTRPGTAASAEKTIFGINASDGLSEAVVENWSKILWQLDGWALHLDAEQPDVQKELQSRFAKHDLNAPRITFNTRLRPQVGSVVLENPEQNDVLRAYAAVVEGAAVVAMNGELFPAQQTGALLEQMGQSQWVVKNREQYQAKAIELATAEQLQGVSDAQLDEAEFHQIGKFTQRFRKILTS
ncbi:MAG: hypothetical protein HKN85_01750 [Gammaproteobacteria bacterium]|nr:hypothetical protein [Gammaproteobacteria bacterium]